MNGLGSKSIKNSTEKPKHVAVIVAHPDDETLWAGGTILSHPSWNWFIVSLCRGKDIERARKFYEALQILQSDGTMGDLDDGPQQKPLEEAEVQQAILELLPHEHYDLILTHNISGEYTQHLRHQEVSWAVNNLWLNDEISADTLLTFAYEDGNKHYLPRAIEKATIFKCLSKKIWTKKHNLITKTYGFGNGSWEAMTTPRAEAFWESEPVITPKRHYSF